MVKETLSISNNSMLKISHSITNKNTYRYLRFQPKPFNISIVVTLN